MKKIKKTFTISVVVKEAKKEFKEGMGVGVLVTQEISYNLTESEYASPLFVSALYDQMERIKNETIVVQIQEKACAQ